MNETNPSLSAANTGRQPTHEEISRRAQELWEKYGRPNDRDEAIWFEAERSLQASAPTPASRSVASNGAQNKPAEPSSARPTGRNPERTGNKASATPRMPQARPGRAAGK